MVKCRSIQARLSQHIDGRLSSTAKASVDAHLHGCKRCHAEHASLLALQTRMSSLPAAQAPEDLAQRLATFALNHEGPMHPIRSMFAYVALPVGVLSIAAAILLFVLAPKAEQAAVATEDASSFDLVERSAGYEEFAAVSYEYFGEEP